MVKVSVIIPVYNVEKYVERTIISCQSQTLFEIEIIIVNDGSKDNSALIIDKKATEDNRIIVIHKENGGVTSARKAGLSIAKGKYIFFLDGDDYIEDNALEKLLRIAEHQKADYVIGNFTVEYEESLKSYEIIFPGFKVVDNITFLKYCFENSFFYITGCLINKEIIKKCGLNVPNDITFGEDNLVITQIAWNMQYAAYYNGPILHYVQRIGSVTNSISMNNVSKRAIACMLTVDYAMEKGFYERLKTEINFFISKEQVGFIKFGYWNDKLGAYRKPSVLFNSLIYRKFSTINILVLFGMFISPSFTIAVYKLLRNFKKIFNEKDNILFSTSE